jgi:hexosaminidase
MMFLARFRRNAWLAIALLLLAACHSAAPRAQPGTVAAQPSPQASIPLIPLPTSMQRQRGHFDIDANTKLVAEGEEAQTVVRYFTDLAAETHGIALNPATDAAAETPAIEFAIDSSSGKSPEAYRLEVSPQRIRITAGEARGLFYGAVTLWQLMARDDDGRIRIPAVRIDDAPRFAWRGLMLDSARHFQSVDEIKQLLDAMALHKLNTFHWHLTDDQGWRIEIRRYPKLTSVGGCRIPAGDGGIDPRSGKPRPYCGYYTQAQIRDVVRYAAERHITVVPEIDVPGHATAAVAAYPQLGVQRGARLAVSNEWGVNTNLFNVEEDTFIFLENVLAEVVELFPGQYVHVGGDEAVEDQWKASKRVQARMRALGLKDEAALQSYFIKRMEKFLSGHGRRLIGWDEILEGGLPPQATVMSWRGIDGALAAASQGHDVVMSPSSDLYFDYLQTNSPNEPPGRPAVIDLRKVYAFEPVPQALDADKQRHIIGLQANVWTEHMRSFARVQHAIFPRIAAVAETAWSPREHKDYDGFLARLPAQLRRYDALGFGYARTPFEVRMTAVSRRDADTASIELSNSLGYDDIRYTVDDSAPSTASPRYRGPIELSLPAEVRAAVFVDNRPLVGANEQRFSTESLLARRDEDLAMCSNALLLRLEDDGPADGERAIFNVDIFDPCWSWKQADLHGIAAIEVRAGRIPYFFQLAHDESHRKFRPAKRAHGELEVRAGCEGALLATAPLPATPDEDGFITLRAPLPPQTTTQDLCLYFTGDTRPTMWTLDRVRLIPRQESR